MSKAFSRLKRKLAISLVFYDLRQACAHAGIRSWLGTRVLSSEMYELIGLKDSCLLGLLILI